jgi:hypothetical protein
MKTLQASFLSLLVLASCERKPFRSEEKIAGVYARETSFEVKHLETGKTLGRSTIRDTIFINEHQQGFQVSQAKWRLNDFDQQGWQNQQHAEDRPSPPYQAIFDPVDRSLQPTSSGLPLYVDLENGQVFKSKNRHQVYLKVP